MSQHIAVIGAGAFGGWTALWLRRKGARVTLLDAWGPGNSRSSSGGETRAIRVAYGADRLYTEWVAGSLPQWKEAEERWDVRLYHRTGVLWMAPEDDTYLHASIPLAREVGLAIEEIPLAEGRRRFPQIDLGDVHRLCEEKEGGYLMARRACRAVAQALVAEGGEYRQIAVRPGPIRDGGMREVALSDGTALRADAFVFACGPWLGEIFPEAAGPLIRNTRQEVFFFGTPPGDPRYSEGRLPVWMDLGRQIFYGMPGNDHRGFKIADDTRRGPIDPTRDERLPSPERLREARDYLARRFPGLAGAPLLEARVCQYENSPDGHLLADRLPGAANAWLLGGGSGHGFKLGPALGEFAADLVLAGGQPLPQLRLDRPGHPSGGKIKTQFTRGKT
jgi:glycine/D-amino acid oxidase-like deaminating enzyme